MRTSFTVDSTTKTQAQECCSNILSEDSSWLDIDHFSQNYLDSKDNATEEQYSADKWGLHSTEDGQAEDGSLETVYNNKGLQYGLRDKGEVRPHSTHVHRVALPAMVTVSDNLELFLYQS